MRSTIVNTGRFSKIPMRHFTSEEEKKRLLIFAFDAGYEKNPTEMTEGNERLDFHPFSSPDHWTFRKVFGFFAWHFPFLCFLLKCWRFDFIFVEWYDFDGFNVNRKGTIRSLHFNVIIFFFCCCCFIVMTPMENICVNIQVIRRRLRVVLTAESTPHIECDHHHWTAEQRAVCSLYAMPVSFIRTVSVICKSTGFFMDELNIYITFISFEIVLKQIHFDSYSIGSCDAHWRTAKRGRTRARKR